MSKLSSAEQAAGLLQGTLLHTQPLLTQTIPLVGAILDELGFRDIMEAVGGDDGDVPVGKALEALVQARAVCEKPLPLMHFVEWASKTVLPQHLELPADAMNEYRLGRVLATISPYIESAWYRLVANAHRVYGFDCRYLIYDVTSIHFEGDYDQSELADFGYSRSGKPDCKQINIGLDVTGPDGVPVAFAVLPGNTNDTSTVVDNLKRIKVFAKSLGIEDMPVAVGDRAMLTPQLMFDYRQARIPFIGTMANGKLQKDLIGEVSDKNLLQRPLPYVAARFEGSPESKLEQERYYAIRVLATVSVPVEDAQQDTAANDKQDEQADGNVESNGCDKIQEDKEAGGNARSNDRDNGQEEKPDKDATDQGQEKPKIGKKKTKELNLWALVVLASGKQRLDSQLRETLLAKCETRLTQIKGHLNKLRYKKKDYAQKQIDAALKKYPKIKDLIRTDLSEDETGQLSLAFSRNEDAIQSDVKYDGKYVIFFSDRHLDDLEVFERFKRRDVVEKRIGNIKGSILLRPVRLHNDDRIVGLVFVTMVALLVSTLAELVLRRHGVNATWASIQKVFKHYAGSLLTFDDHSQLLTTPYGDKWQNQVLRVFRIAAGTATPVVIPDALLVQATAPTSSPWPDTRTHEASSDSPHAPALANAVSGAAIPTPVDSDAAAFATTTDHQVASASTATPDAAIPVTHSDPVATGSATDAIHEDHAATAFPEAAAPSVEMTDHVSFPTNPTKFETATPASTASHEAVSIPIAIPNAPTPTNTVGIESMESVTTTISEDRSDAGSPDAAPPSATRTTGLESPSNPAKAETTARATCANQQTVAPIRLQSTELASPDNPSP